MSWEKEKEEEGSFVSDKPKKPKKKKSKLSDEVSQAALFFLGDCLKKNYQNHFFQEAGSTDTHLSPVESRPSDQDRWMEEACGESSGLND